MVSLANLLPQVWIVPVPSFDPHLDGGVGFSEEDRDRILQATEDVGTNTLFCMVGHHFVGEPSSDLHGRILGLAEVERVRVKLEDRVEPSHFANYQPELYGWALPIRKAWVTEPTFPARSLDGFEDRIKRSKHFEARGAKLGARATIWLLTAVPLKPVSVRGEPRVTEDGQTGTYAELMELGFSSRPSKPFPEKLDFRRSGTIVNASNAIYVLTARFGSDLLAGRALASDERVWKFGIAHDPWSRVRALNSSFPPNSRLQWEVCDFERLELEAAAREAESEFREAAKSRHTLGGEFFAMTTEQASDLFLQATGRPMDPIK